MEYVTISINIDDEFIKTHDVWAVMVPLIYGVDYCGGEEQYYNDLAKFTVPQKYVYAIITYLAEVNNGGHPQFYFNDTGIVWKEAMEGFLAICSRENYEIIKKSTEFFGGSPSMDRRTREEAMLDTETGFEELDEHFYSIETQMLEKLNDYVKANSKDFCFKGEIKVPKNHMFLFSEVAPLV